MIVENNLEGYAWCLRCGDWVKDTLIMLRFNKDLWDEHELVISMKRAAYGTRLTNSTTNDQLTTYYTSYEFIIY